MKKLEQGDYVTNLTEEQFNELIDIENHTLILKYSDYLSNDNILIYGDDCLFTSIEISGEEPTKELTFEEFKQRAINTFQDESNN